MRLRGDRAGRHELWQVDRLKNRSAKESDQSREKRRRQRHRLDGIVTTLDAKLFVDTRIPGRSSR